jgi:hypothetical protein
MNPIIMLLHVIAAVAVSNPAEAAVSLANCLEEDSHVGLAKSETLEQANINAINLCIKSGGTKDCCEIYVTIIKAPLSSKKSCLAAAQGSSGDFGFGIGETEKAAVNSALVSCKHNAIGPDECKVKGTAVCQD